MKIAENERLHKRVAESDMKSRTVVQEMQDQVTRAEAEVTSLKREHEALLRKHDDFTIKCSEDKAFLEKKLLEVESEGRERKSLADASLRELQLKYDELMTSHRKLEVVVGGAVVFDDCGSKNFNRMQLTCNDQKFQTKYRSLVGTIHQHLMSLCEALRKFHVNTRQRAMLYPVDGEVQELPEVTVKLCEHQSDADAMLDDVALKFRAAFVDVTHDVNLSERPLVSDFLLSCQHYTSLVSKLVPWQRGHLESENSWSLCVPNLQAKNRDYLQAYEKFMPMFGKLHTYIQLFVRCSDQDDVTKPLRKIASTLNELHMVLKDLSRALNGKIAIETSLPTTTKSPMFNKCNEHLLAAMLQFSATSAKLSTFLREHEEFFSAEVSKRSHVAPILSSLHQRANSYLQSVNTFTPPRSVPYHDAINMMTSHDDAKKDDDVIMNQLCKANARVEALEHEKENQLLETQLLKMKLDKCAVQPPTGGNQPHDQVSMMMSRVRTNSSTVPLETSQLGKLNVTSLEGDVGSMTSSTEQLIREHMNVRLSETSKRTQVCVTSAVAQELCSEAVTFEPSHL